MIDGRPVCAVIVAAGRSARMGFDKLLCAIDGVPVLRRTAAAFEAHPAVDSLVVVAGENAEAVRALFAESPARKPLSFAAGGATRAHSVRAGLAACPKGGLVAVHDGARPFVSEALITRTLKAAAKAGAAAPALPVKETVKLARGGLVEKTVPRQGLMAVQTPQVFDAAAFAEAFAAIPEAEYGQLTDDCLVMERAGRPVRLVEGEAANIKITTPEDLPMAEQKTALRIGHGYDVHRFAEGRRLVLGGVHVPCEKGLLGHSDADVLLHAVADALLGAAALGDIGQHFPDSDPAYAGADSARLLAEAGRLLRGAGYAPQNIDATLLCQAPKLAPHIPAMRACIAGALGMDESAVSVKATTEEGLGFTGAGQGIAAHCVALVSLK